MAHEDIMPYTAVDKKPIRHDLFERFLEYYEGKGNKLLLFILLKLYSNHINVFLIHEREFTYLIVIYFIIVNYLTYGYSV